MVFCCVMKLMVMRGGPGHGHLGSFPQQLGEAHHVRLELPLVRPLPPHLQPGVVRRLGDKGPAVPAEQNGEKHT